MHRDIARTLRGTALALVAVAIVGCSSTTPKHMQPLSYSTISALEQKGFSKDDPILLRIYKEDSELEVWKRNSKDGKYRHFRTYDICKWSGALGPKKQEGDRQAPEGFYSVTPGQMNPKSSYHLSFNLGYPNTFDRAHGRTGKHLMVHGECSSAGCYAMENDQVQEIYSLAREAFDAGQKSFQVQAFPFRMTPKKMAEHADNENIEFWRMLKDGSDHFEVTGREPVVGVCDRRYVFNTETQEFDPVGPCPADLSVPAPIQMAVAEKQAEDFVEEQIVLARLEKKRGRQAPDLPSGDPSTMIASADQDAPTTTADVTAVGFSSAIPSVVEKAGNGIFGRFRRAPAPLELTPAPVPAEAAPAETAETAEDAVAAAVVDRRFAPPLPALGYLPERWRGR